MRNLDLILKDLSRIEFIELKEDFDFGLLKSSFKVPGIVKLYVSTQNLNSLKKISKYLNDNGLKYTAIGGGSNVIIDGLYDGIFLEYTDNRILKFYDKDGDFILRAFAGIAKSTLLQESIKEELTGLEFLAGIPGKLGGGIAMNAGAYGRDFKTVLKRVAICSGGKGNFYNVEDLNFKYRSLDYPEPYMLTFADISLLKGDKNSILRKVNNNLERKKKTQPLEFPSAGSVFKNPEQQPAWTIIRELGLAGYSIGDAQVSTKHANFIVNKGKAKAKDLLNLIELIKRKAIERFNIKLDEEIKIFGVD